MASNFLQDGQTIDVTLASTVSSGDTFSSGGLVGVYLNDGVSGDVVAVRLEGVFTVAKTTGTAWAVGDVLDYDVSASKFHKGLTPATGDVTDCAVCVSAAASGDTTGIVKIGYAGTAN